MGQSHPAGTSNLIADAAIRVIARDGFDEISVRTVATEAGVAPGTVQHHFGSRDALLVGALNRVMERQLQRIVTLSTRDDPAATLRRSFEELMPFDAVRREEAIVWLVFSAAAPSRQSLRAPHAVGISLMRDLIRNALDQARERGILRKDVDPDIETVLLTATIDGLLIHAVNAEPEGWSVIRTGVDAALTRLFASSGNSRASA